MNVQTDDQNRERKRYTGGVVGNVTESVLVYTLPAVRCEDSGTYTCVGSNGAKLTVSCSATLRVLCEYMADRGWSFLDPTICTEKDLALYFRYPAICTEKDMALYFRYPTICTEKVMALYFRYPTICTEKDMALYFRYPTICTEKDRTLYFRYPTICTEKDGLVFSVPNDLHRETGVWSSRYPAIHRLKE